MGKPIVDEKTRVERLANLTKQLDEMEQNFEQNQKRLRNDQEKYGLFEEYNGGLSLRLSSSESAELRKLMI